MFVFISVCLSPTYLPQQTESGVEIGGAETNHHQEQPDEVDAIATVPGVLLVEDHQEGRHNEEQHVGDGVDELCDVGREGVVVLTPVYRARAPLQMAPHTRSHSDSFTSVTSHLVCKFVNKTENSGNGTGSLSRTTTSDFWLNDKT